MNTTTQTIFVGRPIDEVFDFCTNSHYFYRWMPGVLTSKFNSQEPLTVGATFVQEIKSGKKIERVSGHVLSFEPNQKWSYMARGENSSFRRSWVFESLSKGTKIHYVEEVIASTSTPSFAGLARFFSKELPSDAMKALKRALESMESDLVSVAP